MDEKVWYEDTKVFEKFPAGIKLEEGEHVLKILGKPRKTPRPKFGEPEKMEIAFIFPVEYVGETRAWFVNQTYMQDRDGNPSDSLFAQLVRLGEKNGGLDGAVLKVNVKGKGLKKRYLVELK